jgi:aryl-alcohol dehydrogenase-like predicted oxidoreductase
MTFGEELGWGSSVEESQRIIDRFMELGGNFIDTANFYTRSHSEKIIGDHVGATALDATGWSSPRNSAATYIPGTPTAADLAENRSLRRAKTRYAACRRITLTCIGCITGT